MGYKVGDLPAAKVTPLPGTSLPFVGLGGSLLRKAAGVHGTVQIRVLGPRKPPTANRIAKGPFLGPDTMPATTQQVPLINAQPKLPRLSKEMTCGTAIVDSLPPSPPHRAASPALVRRHILLQSRVCSHCLLLRVFINGVRGWSRGVVGRGAGTGATTPHSPEIDACSYNDVLATELHKMTENSG